MKCSDCRQKEVTLTLWEKIRSWLVWHMFPIDIKDEKANSFTQGFSDGYVQGRKDMKEDIKNTIKELYHIDI